MNETTETVYVVENTIDYTSHFENLEAIGCVLCAIIIGSAIAICFFKGISK